MSNLNNVVFCFVLFFWPKSNQTAAISVSALYFESLVEVYLLHITRCDIYRGGLEFT